VTIREPRQILAVYDDKCITVYQAYNPQIADEALALGRFGSLFKLDRMTWIKSSFLWMMYRSAWGTGLNQERVLAISLSIDGFNEILEQAVLSSFDPKIHGNREEWQQMLKASKVRCQWDLDRTLTGTPLPRRAIQLGIKGRAVRRYANEWCLQIQDISEFVHEVGAAVKTRKRDLPPLPQERVFPVTQKVVRQLGMDVE